jgi:spore coat polysaccharide biosynthesis protein SpsF
MPKVVAAIPCRAGSTRLYAKPLQRIGDKPILTHLIGRLSSIPRLDDIVLAISVGQENLAFVQYAKAHGLPYVRGSELNVLSRLIRAGKHTQADVILRVTSDCPFICTEVIDCMIEKHIENDADLTVMEQLPLGSYGELVNLSAFRKAHRLGGPGYRTAWVTLFIKEHPELFNIQKLTAEPPLNRPDIRITVDYPEDLIVMRKIYEALPGMPSVQDIITFLDEHPNIAAINNWIQPGAARIWR